MNPGKLSCLIGLDAGTTSVKGVLLNSEGELIASSGQEYQLETGPDGSCELDVDIYWNIT